MIVVKFFPIYWGVEMEAPDRSLVTRSTLHEVLPPFRKSVWAFRIRVSHKRWLHIGWFEYDTIDTHWGMGAIPVEEIAKWRGPNVAQEVHANGDGQEADREPDGSDEVRQVE